ncbi:MAG: hypothetical protein MUO50_01920, partial [Longimicrobiales bacterium]|nr:hypothetical protein [Longimicrobiales bacterium]
MSRLVALLFFGALFVAPAQASGQAQEGLGLYRFPDLHGSIVVFAAEGDLWRVPVTGGVAQRLTTHPGEERYPRVSPDGTLLAFSAQYEGPTEIYTMPLGGGLPVRRTYEGEASTTSSWTPDGRLVYSTTHYATLPQSQLVALDLAENRIDRIPLYTATEGAYDETGQTLYFVRPAFHNNVTKRYTGGTARDVWKFAEGASEAVELTGDYDGESHSPMTWQGRVYFVTDRDGTMNLWSMDGNGDDVRQHTRHSGWDVKNPALDQGRIIYQLGADLWLYDIASDQARVVPITLASDFDQLREKWVDDPASSVSSVHLHPKGESVVITARGRVFVAPVDRGRLVQASVKDGVRYRDVTFMPDGERLLGLSDETGELEWVTFPANGIGEGEPLTDDGTILRFQGHPSPDGHWVAYTDNSRDLWILNVATGEQTLVSEDREGVGGMSWSPDSRWLAFEKAAPNTFTQIRLYSPGAATRAQVTSDRVNSFAPAWDPAGDFLYFLSDRNLNSLIGGPWGPRAPGPFFDRENEIFHVSLRPGLRSPFSADDELTETSRGGDASPGSASETSQETTPRPVEIELSGLMA